MTKEITDKILNDYLKSEGKCPFCGAFLYSPGLHGAGHNGWERDHGNPQSRGGKRTRAVCTHCNRMKGAKTGAEFKVWYRKKQEESLLYKFTGHRPRI